jgi:uroporphyrinogen-III synthase
MTADALPLAGIRVAVPATRRAAETAALVGRWGGEPVVAPLLEEIPVEDEGPLRAATEAVIGAPATWSVHLTGVGTRRWFQRAEGWGLLDDLLGVLRAGAIIPRGQKARGALAERDLTPTWIPDGETSAEIAEWLVPRLGPGQTVSVQLFGEPVPSFTDRLRATGATLIEVAPYQWALPADPADRAAAEGLVTALAAGSMQALVITSAVQATNLFVVARTLGLEDALRSALTGRVFTAAVGEVARGGLEREAVPVDLVAEPPRMGALIRSLAEAAGQVRAKSAC